MNLARIAGRVASRVYANEAPYLYGKSNIRLTPAEFDPSVHVIQCMDDPSEFEQMQKVFEAAHPGMNINWYDEPMLYEDNDWWDAGEMTEASR